MIVNILEGKPLRIYGDGRSVRDWLHVSDDCRAIEQVLIAGRPGEVYNVGSRSECENIALVRQLCSIGDAILGEAKSIRDRFPRSPASLGISSTRLIQSVEDRPGHDRRYAFDCGDAEREFGFVPRIEIIAALAKTFQNVHNHNRGTRFSGKRNGP